MHPEAALQTGVTGADDHIHFIQRILLLLMRSRDDTMIKCIILPIFLKSVITVDVDV